MSVSAAENGRAGTYEESALLGRTRTVFRRTGRDLRDALALVAEIESLSSSVHVAADDEINDEITEDVTGLLRAFRDEHPGQEIEVIFVALKEGQGGGTHGRSTGDRDR